MQMVRTEVEANASLSDLGLLREENRHRLEESGKEAVLELLAKDLCELELEHELCIAKWR